MSLEEGIVHVEWEEANIIPLFKTGSRNKSVNYRPVSLISVICKLSILPTPMAEEFDKSK